MKIKVHAGGSQEDSAALHFRKVGIIYDRTIAIFFPKRNTIEIGRGNARKVSAILDALRKYQPVKNPVNILYW